MPIGPNEIEQTVAVAAGTVADTVIKAGAGYLQRVLITTTGTNPLQIFDNASGHTGTIIGAFPASPAIGALTFFQAPAQNGITVQGHAANPAFTVTYI